MKITVEIKKPGRATPEQITTAVQKIADETGGEKLAVLPSLFKTYRFLIVGELTKAVKKHFR